MAEVFSLRRFTSERRNHAPLSTLIGWSGLSAALAGVLFVVWGYVDRKGAPWYLDLAVLVLEVVVPLLFLVGLAGAYAKLRTQASWLGVIGFVIGFAAAGWATVKGVMMAPTLYSQLGERSWPQESWPSALLGNALTWLLVGLTIVGLTAVRKGVVRDWSSLLLTMALFGWVYHLTDDITGIVDVRSIHVVFGVLFSLSWMVLGYALWSTSNTVGRTAIRSKRSDSGNCG
jgi:hypothetical protein